MILGEPQIFALGQPLGALARAFHERGLVLAPDGDQVFDDSSRILHFDCDGRVRIVAYRPVGCSGADGTTDLVDVEIATDIFYGTIDLWLQRLRTLREIEIPGARWPMLDVADG